jgi:hypothetical protein
MRSLEAPTLQKVVPWQLNRHHPRVTRPRIATRRRTLLVLALAVVAPIGCDLVLDIKGHHAREAGAAGDQAAGTSNGDGVEDAGTAVDGVGDAGTSDRDAVRDAGTPDVEGGGDARGPDAGKWVVLASGEPWPIAITVGGGYVYWINGAHAGAPGSIQRMPTDGGSVQTVAQGLSNPTSMVLLKDDLIYFTNDRDGDGGTPGIWRVSKEGLSAHPNEVPDPVTTDGLGVNAIELENVRVYSEAWEPEAPARLRISAFPSHFFPTCYPYETETGGRILDLTIASSDLYLIDQKKNAIMHTGADCDGGSSVFAANQPAIALGLSSGRLYWLTKTALRSRDLDGGPDAAVTELTGALSDAAGFTFFSGGVVVTNNGAGTVVFTGSTSGDLPIAWGQNDPWAIAHDVDGVYWTNRAGGEIVRRAPPFE